MSKKKEALQRRLARLEESLSKEKARTTRVMNNIGWGTGMRCTKCTPSFRREDELKGKIHVLESQIKELETIETMEETTKKPKPRHKWEEISRNRWRCSKCGCKKDKVCRPYPEYLTKDGQISRKSPECITENNSHENRDNYPIIAYS